MVSQCSLSWTLSVPTTRFLWSHQIFLRLPLQHHLDCLSSDECRNVAQTFQHFMDQVLRGLDFCYIYIDDVLIASRTTEEYKIHICLVLQRFVQYGILINPVKCVLGVTELRFLGHYVNKDGVSPFPDQVQVIQDFSHSVNYRSSWAW